MRPSEKVLKKVLSQRFSFNESKADLNLLRSIDDGTYAHTKSGDPSFHAYASAINAANEFATQALDIRELIPFNNLLADLQEEHMPSYPPMSPVTSAFFASWVVLDARDPFSGLTLGQMLLQYLRHVGKLGYFEKAMATLNESYCSFYEVTQVDVDGLTLWDIAGLKEVDCWNASGYSGTKGEIWFVRLIPPFVEGSGRSVTMGTPYVFREGDRHTWESFFQRYSSSGFGASHSLRDYLKFGKSLGYWVEFIFQAFAGYTPNMVRLTGVPDNPASLPHSSPKHKL